MQSFRNWIRTALALTAVWTCTTSLAQMTPVGTWHSFDEKSGEVKSEIVIEESPAGLRGYVSKLLRKDADQSRLCTECSDDRKGKPMLGLEIIRGAKKMGSDAVWSEGKILDPENGKEYALKMTPIEDGKKLEVRGSILFIGRTQTWSRVK